MYLMLVPVVLPRHSSGVILCVSKGPVNDIRVVWTCTNVEYKFRWDRSYVSDEEEKVDNKKIDILPFFITNSLHKCRRSTIRKSSTLMVSSFVCVLFFFFLISRVLLRKKRWKIPGKKLTMPWFKKKTTTKQTTVQHIQIYMTYYKQ